MNSNRYLLLRLVAIMLLSHPRQASAQQTTAFTYQGQLRDGGTNANGIYAMIFKLYDAVTSGNPIGNAITNNPTLANGLFSVNLDFGATAFNGSARWLDITVQAGTNAPEILTPRVQVLPAPYALYAATAGNIQATNVLGAFTGNVALKQGATGATLWDIGVGNFQAPNGPLFSDTLIFSLAGTPQLILTTNGLAVVTGALYANGAPLPLPQVQVFNTSGIFVVPPNVTRIMVEVWGGGGGGGGNAGTAGNGAYTGGGGGGGGGGAFGKGVISVTPGNIMTVTVGSGGTGGSRGTNTVFNNVDTSGTAGGAGGTSSLGSVSATGGAGGDRGGSAGFSNGNPGNGGTPGSSSAPIEIRGGSGFGGFNPVINGNFNQADGAGGNGGAGGIDGQSPGGGGRFERFGAPGRVIVWY